VLNSIVFTPYIFCLRYPLFLAYILLAALRFLQSTRLHFSFPRDIVYTKKQAKIFYVTSCYIKYLSQLCHLIQSQGTLKDMKYDIPKSDKELLRQCQVQVFRGSGPGGQGVNTADSAVRLIHEPSGITIVARNERSQLMNKRAALKRLRYQLEAANYRPPKRISTKPSRASQKRRLDAKKRQSDKKKDRRRIID